MKVSLILLVVAALCGSLVTAQFPRLHRQGRLFPFGGWRRPFARRNPPPIRLYRFYPSHVQQNSASDNSYQPIPVTRFVNPQQPFTRLANPQQPFGTSFQPSTHFNRGHAGPQPSSEFSSYSSIDALPLEPFNKNVPAAQNVGGTQIPVLRDVENPPPAGDNDIVVHSEHQVAIVPGVEIYQQLNLVETPQSEVADVDDSLTTSVEGTATESVQTPIASETTGYSSGETNPDVIGYQVIPIGTDIAVSTSPAEIRPILTVPRAPQDTKLFESPINSPGNDFISGHLQAVPKPTVVREQKFDQPKTESIVEIDATTYQVKEKNRPEPSFENVRVIQTILPPSRTKDDDSRSGQTPDEQENVIALTEEEFDELAKDIAESFVIIPSPAEQLDKDDKKSVQPNHQKADFLTEVDSSSNAPNSKIDTNRNAASPIISPPSKDIPIRATPSILIEQLKQNYPPKSIQDTIASTEDTTDSPSLPSDSLSELISGSSGAVPVISVPEISGLYLTPTADDPSVFRGGIGGLPLQDHRTGEASANVGVAVLPEAIPLDGKTRGMGYRFSYSVEDEHSGTSFSRFEQSDGERTQGNYRVLLPDGRTQVVKFFDGGQGFQADVAYV